MDSLIQALGLDIRILLAQLLNFSILVFILWRFAYRPLFSLLEKRRKKIEQGMKDSDEASIRLEKSVEESRKRIAQARQEASGIIEEAQKKAEIRYEEILTKAQDDLKKQSELEKEKIKQERLAIATDVKKEMSNLLVLGLEKFLQERMDEDRDKKVIEKIAKELS